MGNPIKNKIHLLHFLYIFKDIYIRNSTEYEVIRVLISIIIHGVSHYFDLHLLVITTLFVC